MDEPKSLDSIFKEKIFRIPDYQRGYAWQVAQLKDFWEDLINLSSNRSHYTGVLTLNEVPNNAVPTDANEFWLIEDHSYRLYHIVDGQQRLTTFIIFLQAFVDFVMAFPDNQGKQPEDVYVTDSLNISAIQEKYLYKIKPTGGQYRTYKFGYTEDNPSYKYLRYRILNEENPGNIEETFYTLNLKNAKIYFHEQFAALHEQSGMDGLREVYKKLVRSFMFNEYVIRDAFDVFVAFETMNNRGKKLSDLELLKNRLIYLTTLYGDQELDEADRRILRESVNETWKEVYGHLGRNEKHPLSDDEFLRAHWIMFYKYSRQTGRDYARFLLDDQFSPRRVQKKVEKRVELEQPEELVSESDQEEGEEENNDIQHETEIITVAELRPLEIREYVDSLKASSIYWFTSWFPAFIDSLAPEEYQALDRLNRIGIGYFRPLVMAILKNIGDVKQRIYLFDSIERFIFLAFRMNGARANYGSSEFYNAARDLDRGKITPAEIGKKLSDRLEYIFKPDFTMKATEFLALLERKFADCSGYYGWAGLRYFLYEYEVSLLNESRQKKVNWTDLLKTPKDKISIEHVAPQIPSDSWKNVFTGITDNDYTRYTGSLGNLILLSMGINAALQNDSFENKKNPKYNEGGVKIRNGYSDGSHSEIEVAQYPNWGPVQIKARGLKLLDFMEKRWNIKFGNDREKFLFLPGLEDDSV
ncbi:MAG TPA: DUF262 domain-containing HNH endonuclease family protein [Smithellaceae bacterium]|nr:DUF262 domain-containing HNH endonuclease family protein [Smithellaceae bacterium]